MEERPHNSDRPRGDRPSRPSNGRPSSSGRPSSGRPSSDRPSSGRPSSSRPQSREERPARGGRSDRAGATRQVSQGREVTDPRGFRPAPQERDQSRIRPRIFEPDIPEDVTGEELEKSVRAELLSLSAENAKVVARHMVCVNLYMDIDPELSHKHAVAAAHHAGRLAVVRETAGYAAYRAGHYEIALKELRASNRISGDVSMWPVMADCERGLGNPLKALNLAGSDEVKRLAKPEEIEMRIVASGARRDLGEFDAAVVTLQCKELKNESEDWAFRLRYAYADSLEAAGRKEEAREWFSKCADLDPDEETDAFERSQK
jgi:tetratricopeptide (TPR) repeat protein